MDELRRLAVEKKLLESKMELERRRLEREQEALKKESEKLEAEKRKFEEEKRKQVCSGWGLVSGPRGQVLSNKLGILVSRFKMIIDKFTKSF